MKLNYTIKFTYIIICLLDKTMASPRGGIFSNIFSSVFKEVTRPLVDRFVSHIFKDEKPNQKPLNPYLRPYIRPTCNSREYLECSGLCKEKIEKDCSCKTHLLCLLKSAITKDEVEERTERYEHGPYQPRYESRPNYGHYHHQQHRPPTIVTDKKIKTCFYHEHTQGAGYHSHNCHEEPHGFHFHDYQGNTYHHHENGHYYRAK